MLFTPVSRRGTIPRWCVPVPPSAGELLGAQKLVVLPMIVSPLFTVMGRVRAESCQAQVPRLGSLARIFLWVGNCRVASW